ncbi:thioredoxin family protein [Zavarzinella formosa]|uniref:thioredoxin family protein n=1 Tax=Zavarzinella formosa TaxID=360055 RepID=UPI000316648C|nr:thioredoxin family protein [Zavarzinella formosa]
MSRHWKTTTAIAGMLVLLTWNSARSGEKNQVEWRVDYDAARKESTEKGKPLFLEFMTEDCFHCRRLEAGPFKDEEIVTLLNERFIPLRVDATRSPKLVQALRIQAYPTMIIAATDGKIVGFLEGFLEAKPLEENLKRSLAIQTPDWMARDFQEASKAIGNGDYAKAVSLLKNIGEDGKDRPVQTKAAQVLQEIEQQATGRLVRVKQLQDKGSHTEALDLLTELMSRYAGTQSAADGAKMLTALAERPENRNNHRARRAQDLLAQAREAYKAEKFHESLDLCEILETTYVDLKEGKQGKELAAEIRSSPEKLTKACENLNERLATMYATLGETWMKKGERELAANCYEKAVRAAPASLIARDSQGKLAQLQTKPPAIPVNFAKPEK